MILSCFKDNQIHTKKKEISKKYLVSGSCQLYQTGGLWLSSDSAPQTTTHLKLSTQSQRLPLQDEQIPAGSIKKQQLFQSRKETKEKKIADIIFYIS